MTDEAGIGPSERQVNTLIFQQLCRFQIFDEKPETLSPKERFQLVAVSAKYGYAFIGTNSATIKVIKIDDLVRISDERQESPGTTVSDYPHEKLSLSDKPLHIAVDCQEQVISVITKGDANLRVHIFDIVNVCKQASSAKAFLTTGLSKETDVDLIDLQWNPVTPSLFAVCLSDGTAELWTWSEGKLSLLSSLPQIFKADAFCWSPKGKQIVIGTNDGQLLQFTHNMEQKKIVPKPDFTNEAVKVVDILWISTFMWVVAYIDEEETVQPNLAIVHAPKEQPVSFINFEDICYGSGEDRKSKYYMKFLDKWGFVIASSGNSMETGILGHKPDVKTSWDVWTLEDTARVELPLCDSDDTFLWDLP
ncbi:putative nuclear pore complex protein [Apostichopus japonicus]|uniref:Putative nuclear pore complex protein n=1 Tax=Stichopus japonicus TaxID=307972 RepID=A0A2G8JVE6_STIJA|nr:putative nuclear pore complex protein [Apostichopus japonicus]